MTTKTDYTEDEWARLVRGPLVAGLAISIADPGGPIELVKETAAALRTTQAAPGEPLLSEISTDIAEKAQRRENALGGFKVESASMAGQQVLDELRAIDLILRTKADASEADAYRGWILDVAQASADAAKEGGFLGIGAEQVSDGERRMLERLRDALGMTSATPPGAQ